MRLLLLLVLIAIIAFGIICALVYRKYEPVVSDYWDNAIDIVNQSTPDDFRIQQTSYIYDKRGKQLVALKLDKDVSYVRWKQIPKVVVDATIAIEDKRFWEHSGVDWMSTAKAGYLYLQDSEDIKRGGSTITQQLVKNTYLSFEKSLERKCKEIFIALEMEKRYSKEQIFEFYVNNINYANGYYGIGAAAKGYFNKSLNDLRLEEVAFLCAIPNNPSLYDPLRHIDNTISRKNIILDEMYAQGYINQHDYLMASNSPIHFYNREKKSYNYETSYAIECATKVLMKKSNFRFRTKFKNSRDYKRYQKRYEEAFQNAKTLLYSGGYKVYTSIDSKVQKYAQKSLDAVLKKFTSKSKDGVYKVQGACTIVDNATGNVVAIIGGRKQNFGEILTLNRAYQSYRQPGSTFKPLAVYTPAFEHGYEPSTIVNDEPIKDGPSNSNGQYSGKVTLRKAIEQSKNVVAWNVFNSIGPKTGISYVQRMGFSKIVPSDYYLSSALGGLTYGVTTVEMASGYCTLANDGIYREPTCITKITLADGTPVSINRNVQQIYEKNAARTASDVLQGVAKHGTAHDLKIDRGMPIACKTGTTNNQTNGWFCSYTPYYTTACYVGADSPMHIDDLWGATYPMQITEKIQNYVNKEKKVIKFKKPVTVKSTNKTKKHDDTNRKEYLDPEEATSTPFSSDKPEAPSVVESNPEEVVDPKVTKKPRVTKKPNRIPTEKPKPTESAKEVTPEPEITDEPIEPDNTEEPDIIDEY